MKILLAVRSLNVGGTERQIVELAKALTAAHHEVHVAVIVPDGELESDLQANGQIPVHRITGSGLYRMFRFRKLVKSQRYDAIYGFLPNMNLLLLATKMMRNRPLIVWGVRSSHLDLSEYPRLVRMAYRVEKMMSRFADVIITNSRSAEIEYKARGYKTRRIISIPNAIDTERFSPDAAARESVTNEHGIPADAKIIGIFARIHPMKDHRTFVDAAALLLKNRPDVHYLIVGGHHATQNAYDSALKAVTEAPSLADNIHWLGQQLNPQKLMAVCDLTSLTSSQGEGFPNAIAESLACGTPVVSTDVGDAAEIIGDFGKVTPIKDSAKLATAWQEILDLPADEMTSLGEQARASIIDRYSRSELASATLAALSTS